MLTLAAQGAISVCLLLFGLIALRIATGAAAHQPVYRHGWALTGAAFLVQAVNKSFHDAFAIAAYLGGPTSGTWAHYLEWNAALNHSRTFLLTAFCLLLAYSFTRARPGDAPVPARAWLPIFVLAMVLGAIAGIQEDVFTPLRHYTSVAIWDVMELLAMLLVLFLGMSSGRMERGLWACLGVNAFILALSVLWFAALSRVGVGSEWAPRPYQIQLTKAALYAAMIVIAFRQLRRVTRGERLKGLIEVTRSPMMPSLHG
ncbi:hypothetical protein [Longimicrobium sp.]|jgi:hypothetical protein|uniref:hypothetical protein n=1 Tax=Longimicrobium sp. TaxID=2029185 RepID=UPI002F9260B3